ncbi:hypothetical protein QAD02_000808 [Eretmocerus hayati]|uniref:Uncharacterized protein n=1 Tax=Eretmocerus hayati TaxID=131215 RepID=A0ACC2NE92_9HYME|nr:hypothetical protein QAD02_000808 [Eretmocerus hayati]
MCQPSPFFSRERFTLKPRSKEQLTHLYGWKVAPEGGRLEKRAEQLKAIVGIDRCARFERQSRVGRCRAESMRLSFKFLVTHVCLSLQQYKDFSRSTSAATDIVTASTADDDNV